MTNHLLKAPRPRGPTGAPVDRRQLAQSLAVVRIDRQGGGEQGFGLAIAALGDRRAGAGDEIGFLFAHQILCDLRQPTGNQGRGRDAARQEPRQTDRHA